MSIDQELLRVSAECDRLIAERDALAARVQKMRKALERISRWNGEFPPTGIFRKGADETMSYGAAYGSNGERDYMRYVAGQALDTPDTSAQIPARREAVIWMEAANWIAHTDLSSLSKEKQAEYTLLLTCYIEGFRARADELLKGLEKEHG